MDNKVYIVIRNDYGNAFRVFRRKVDAITYLWEDFFNYSGEDIDTFKQSHREAWVELVETGVLGDYGYIHEAVCE